MTQVIAIVKPYLAEKVLDALRPTPVEALRRARGEDGPRRRLAGALVGTDESQQASVP
jgi:hypothetical protein